MDYINIINAKQISLWQELFVDYIVISNVGPLGANYHMGANRIANIGGSHQIYHQKEGSIIFFHFLVESIIFA